MSLLLLGLVVVLAVSSILHSRSQSSLLLLCKNSQDDLRTRLLDLSREVASREVGAPHAAPGLHEKRVQNALGYLGELLQYREASPGIDCDKRLAACEETARLHNVSAAGTIITLKKENENLELTIKRLQNENKKLSQELLATNEKLESAEEVSTPSRSQQREFSRLQAELERAAIMIKQLRKSQRVNESGNRPASPIGNRDIEPENEPKEEDGSRSRVTKPPEDYDPENLQQKEDSASARVIKPPRESDDFKINDERDFVIDEFEEFQLPTAPVTRQNTAYYTTKRPTEPEIDCQEESFVFDSKRAASILSKRKASSASRCKRMCSAEEECISWTFVTDTSECLFHPERGTPISAKCCVSGVSCRF